MEANEQDKKFFFTLKLDDPNEIKEQLMVDADTLNEGDVFGMQLACFERNDKGEYFLGFSLVKLNPTGKPRIVMPWMK